MTVFIWILLLDQMAIIRPNGYWTKWILDQMDIGPIGYWTKWVLDQIDIRPNGYWTNWAGLEKMYNFSGT